MIFVFIHKVMYDKPIMINAPSPTFGNQMVDRMTKKSEQMGAASKFISHDLQS